MPPISTIEQIVLCILIVTLLGLYNALLIKDDRTPEDSPDNEKIEKQWHIVGGGLFLVISYTFARLGGWLYIPLVLSSFWLIFAGIVHEIGLKKGVFFVGIRAVTDRLIRGMAVKLHLHEGTMCAIVKVLAMVVSITAFIIFK